MLIEQASAQCGLSARLLSILIGMGVLDGLLKFGLINPNALEHLEEGAHYVTCRMCGGRLAQVTATHLRVCSGLSLSTYSKRYPDANLVSDVVSFRRKKTPEQRANQSRVLKARFRTDVGQKTRLQISAAVLARLQEPAYHARVASQLKTLNSLPEVRRTASKRFKALWQDPGFVEKQAEWRRHNSEAVEQSAARARQHLKHTFTGPHRQLKKLMVDDSIAGFLTEYKIGFYSIDEGNPELKIAVEVDGCYWHGCSTCGFEPVKGNARLDRRKNTYLRNRGWVVLRIRACDLKRAPLETLGLIQAAVAGRSCGR